ncbi:MAG TPA: potassium channel family protein [Vicinamibacteria bacterium]|nr:potassium channel family protein [Vicinamibacteria bacterium]
MKLRIVAALARFWADDRGLSLFSGFLFVAVFLLPPLLRQGSGRRLAADVVYALLLLSGVLALGGRGLARIVPMAVAVVAVAVNLGSWVWPVSEPWVEGTNVVSLLLFLVVVLAKTLRAGPVTFHRIQGAIAAYVLLGMIWAYAYALLALLRPGAFSGAVNPTDGPRAWFYFSFVTLTTVGYGDVLPVHPVARSLAILEAVTGPLYLAILVARLVSQTAAPAGNAATAGGRE